MASPEYTIYHVFSTFAVGGPQRRFAMLANNLPGIRHVVTAMDNCYDAEYLLGDHVSYELRPLRIFKSRFFSPKNISALRAQIQADSPDLLCTYNWGAIEAVIANNGVRRGGRLVPHLHFEDGFGPDESPARQNWKRTLARRFILRDTKVIVPSSVLNKVAIKSWRLPPENILCVINGIVLDEFTPSDREPGRKVVIGSLGALRLEKNIGRLIRLFSEQNLKEQARLMIAGDGPERENLEAQAKSLGIEEHVTFTGHTEDPASLYRQFDIFALTSDTEQRPFGVIEAMASGLPVVATSVGDVPAMVSEENRPFVVPRGEDARLGRELSRLVHSRNLREEIGAANLKAARKQFDISLMINAYKDLFEKVAGFTWPPETR